ncbi:MAG: hypothetical protein ACRYG4_14035 [Janthinobacterium lividum]
MIKTMFAFGALTLAIAAPAAAQMATGALPRCSATVHDSCDQGANNPKAMSAEQAMKSGGVGDRADDGAAKSMPMAGKPMHHRKHHTTTTTTTTGAASSSDATPK